jgi:membrane protease YdiL (CAAX protease family)
MSRAFHRLRRRPLVGFFVLANAITWLCMLPMLLNLSQQTKILSVLPSLAVYGPLLAALVVAGASEGLPGLRDLWHRATKWRVAVRWYAIVFFLPVAVNALAVGISLPFVGSWRNRLTAIGQLYDPILLLPGQLLTGGLEEPGWRGYALPRLEERFSSVRSSWILGALWALWHLPYALAKYASPSTTMADLGFIAAVEIMGVARILGWTFLFTWVYDNTESALLTLLLHAWINTVDTYAVSAFPYLLTGVLLNVLPCCIVAPFLITRAFRARPRSDT